MTLDDLIAKLEAATDGSRTLDTLIERVIVAPGQSFSLTTPPYTSSLDAALTLVPEGLDEEIKRARHRKGWHVALWKPSRIGQIGDAPIPALALCIAALKARNQ